MGATGKIAKNSLWLILEPLVLNLISLVVTAYIARTLGRDDYGKFIFANAFAMMFMPIGDMGLRTLTIRTLAEKPPDPEVILGKILTIRAIFITLGYGLIVLTINLMNYPDVTRYVVYIACLAIIPRALTTVAHDVFEAHERMKYVAYSNILAGLSLTALSVAVLALGYRLYALTSVYVIGRVLGVILAGYYLTKHFIRPRLGIDFAFMKSMLAKGAIFFYPSFVYALTQRVGIVFLSKFSGDASVGIFGAAYELVDRLIIIPDGIAGAFFPTLIRVFRESQEAAQKLFQQFYGYSILMALPVAVGGTIVAPQIIELIYGPAYEGSVVVFQLMMWWLFLRFMLTLSSWTMGAIHQEKQGALVVFITTPIFLALCSVAIPTGGEIGLSVATVVKELLAFILMTIFLQRGFMKRLFDTRLFLKAALASAIMGAAVWAVAYHVLPGKWGLFISVPAGSVVYVVLILVLGIVSLEDLKSLRGTLSKKKAE